jgi:hypothetical protein
MFDFVVVWRPGCLPARTCRSSRDFHFPGRIFHAADCYSEEVNREHFGGKRVLIVGAAFSGTEIAGQLIDVAEKVTVGLRNPMWFLPRWVSPWEGAPRYPADLVFYNRDIDNPLTTHPRDYLRAGGDPGAIRRTLPSTTSPSSPDVVTSDDFLPLVAAGASTSSVPAPSLRCRWVLYADGTREDIDAVVM